MRLKILILAITLPNLYSCDRESNEVNCSALIKNGIEYFDDDDLYSGICLVFDKDVLVEKRKIQNGLHKTTIGYWNSGELKYTGGMKNDSLNGSFREYYRSGKIAKKGKFKMGYYNGRWKFTDEDGRILRITTFKKGKIISETTKN